MRRLLLASTLVLVSFCSLPTRADDPCSADVQRLCPKVEAGSSRIISCLRDNEEILTTSCRERLASDALKARRLIQAFGTACNKDVQDLCPGVEPGEGRVLRCLDQHQLEVSTPCQGQLLVYGRARDRVERFRTACKADLQRLCNDVPRQAVPLRQCLDAHETQLSSGCSRDAIREAADAASIVDSIEETTRADRLKETLEILQGVDSVAFSRSQILVQYDSYRKVAGMADGARLLLNPQFVFGEARLVVFAKLTHRTCQGHVLARDWDAKHGLACKPTVSGRTWASVGAPTRARSPALSARPS